MTPDFTDKTVLVTGGSRGIGLACVQAFANAGATVASAARHAHDGSKPGVNTYTADLSDAQQAQTLVDAVQRDLGSIDILVNCAGAARRYPAATLTAQDWADAMNAKFFPYVHAMDAVLAGMRERRCGVIVNIIGVGGKHPAPTHLPGGAANAALMLATSGLAAAWAGHGIRINGINPGPTQTERVQGALQAQAEAAGISAEAARAQMLARIPMGRLALPEEVAHTVLFLASDQAAYVSGALIAMDGCAHACVV